MIIPTGHPPGGARAVGLVVTQATRGDQGVHAAIGCRVHVVVGEVAGIGEHLTRIAHHPAGIFDPDTDRESVPSSTNDY